MPDSPDLDTMLGEVIRRLGGAQPAADDSNMVLTLAEKNRALRIKAALAEDDRIDRTLTDYELVQYALVTNNETMEQVCERVYRMQEFCRQYRIDESDNPVREGAILFHQMTVEHPGFNLAVEFLPVSQNYVSVLDFAAFNPQRVKSSEESWRVYFAGCFFLDQCLMPDISCIRNGISLMVECMDSTSANIDLGVLERQVVEFTAHYPMRSREIFFLNSHSVTNMACALWKRFLPVEMRKQFQLGQQIPGWEGQRIDLLYNTPTPEEARERMLLRVVQLLHLRYQNQANFSLATARIMENINNT